MNNMARISHTTSLRISFLVFLAAFLMVSGLVFVRRASAVSGVFTIGPTGSYPTLTAAIADINTNGGATGAIVLELQANYTSASETFPINPKITGASATNTITIRPQSGATALSIQSSAAQTFNFDAASFVTVDGRPGGSGTSKELTIDNTSTAGQAIQFINDASSNTIEYSIVKGVNTSASSGVIVFSTTTGTTGNDSNTIDTCDIQDGASTPTNSIASIGTSGKDNDHNTVSNCNISNFFNAGASTNGIFLTTANTAWTITGNRFFQTTARTFTGTNVSRAIQVVAGSGYSIASNTIGFASSAGTGTWVINGTVSNRFVGIDLNVGTSTATSVQGNTIANISLTTTSTTASGAGVFSGINIVGGNVNVGTTSANTIGSGTGTGSILVAATNSDGVVNGIVSGSSGTVAISNNTIGSMTTSPTGVNRLNLVGIQVTAGTNTISNNLVGSATTANSLNASGTASSTTSGQFVNGILSSSATSANITNNTIANLNNAYTSTNSAGVTRGIAVTAGLNTITGNTIRNITSAALNNGGTQGASGPLQGISDTSATAGQTISRNVIHSLTANYFFTGMFFSWAGSVTNVISGNFVHSLNIATPSAGLSIIGIRVWTGTATFSNNMVRLGFDANGNSITYPLALYGILKQDTTPACNAYFNSVFIGGTGVTNQTTQNTYAFARGGAPTSGTDDIRDNVFVNARSNSTSTGKHYAYALFTSAASLTSDYNDYYVSGAGGVLANIAGSDQATLSAIQSATGGDAHSLSADPLFINPTGTASTVDLHLSSVSSPAANVGTNIASVTTDFDGDTRDATAPDIGADEIISAQFSSATYSVNEGAGTATITVSRTAGSASGATVNYATSNNTATGGASCTGSADYVTTSGTLNFAAGDTSKTFTVPICDDAVYEGNELVNLTLSNATGDAIVGSPSTATLTILENDAEPQPNVTITDVTQNEGNSGTSNFNFTVNLSSTYSQDITVNYSTADGTATAGSDYTACTGCSIIIPAGQTSGTIAVPVKGDTQFEASETFTVNLNSVSAGNITDNQGQGTITNDDSVVAPTSIMITEFRLRGPNGENDEFIELYNNTDSDIVVGDANPVTCALQLLLTGPTTQCGWAIVDLQGGVSNIPRAVIPIGQVISARGYYLIANEGTITAPGYSLGAYATPDLTYSPVAYGDADYTGLVLYRTADRAQFNSSNKLDAVGFNGVALPYREGNGLQPSNGVGEDAEFSFVRKFVSDFPVDTGDNLQDFNFVSTGGTALSGKLPLLGAPGPQGKTSARRDGGIVGSLVPGVADRVATAGNFGSLAPNGILTFQRRYLNNTGHSITKLRFRVYDITTLNSPDMRAAYGSTSTRQAILRVLDRASATVIVNGQTLEGLVLEQPPTQTAQGGGMNSSLNVESVLTTPLPNQASVDVQFRLGIEGGGFYRFFVIFEAAP